MASTTHQPGIRFNFWVGKYFLGPRKLSFRGSVIFSAYEMAHNFRFWDNTMSSAIEMIHKLSHNMVLKLPLNHLLINLGGMHDRVEIK